MRVIKTYYPDFRKLAIHESSPGNRGASVQLAKSCGDYSSSHYFPNIKVGQKEPASGILCQNLESMTFPDNSFDIFVTQDVMEHIFDPAAAFREIARVLKPGGAHIFTVPIVNKASESERRASLSEKGKIIHHREASYHGNPIDSSGSLVTMDWGYDIVPFIYDEAGTPTTMITIDDLEEGIRAEFIEVLLSKKRRSVAKTENKESRIRFSESAETLAADAAEKLKVSAEIHPEDFIFRFIYDNPVFNSKTAAVDYYFNDGRRSAEKVRASYEKWLGANAGEAPRVLEFACGHGAVTRHLKSVFPDVQLQSSDSNSSAMTFIEKQFGIATLQTPELPEEFNLQTKFDFIFALSFFSRIPQSTWRRWLKALFHGLNEGGLLLFTTHGKVSMNHFPQAELDQFGYWFERSREQKGSGAATGGQAITSRSYVDTQVKALKDVELLEYQEASWWEHQDHYILRKGGVKGS